MASRLHHVAVNSANFDQTVRFFQEVFDMEISRKISQISKKTAQILGFFLKDLPVFRISDRKSRIWPPPYIAVI